MTLKRAIPEPRRRKKKRLCLLCTQTLTPSHLQVWGRSSKGDDYVVGAVCGHHTIKEIVLCPQVPGQSQGIRFDVKISLMEDV